MKKLNYYLVLVFCSFFILVACQQVLALDVGLQFGGQSGLGTKDLRVTIAEVVRTTMGILGVIDFVLLLLCGFYFMLSKGDPEGMGKAKKIMIAALIGLVIIMSAFAFASFILSMLIENAGPQPPIGIENLNGGGPISENFNGNQMPINSEFPTTYLCKGTVPANATICPSPNATGLIADTQNELVLSCSNDPIKCEYICQIDFNKINNNCVNGDPSLPSDYQAYYSFTTNANDLSSNNFNGTVYHYSDGTFTQDPSAISNGYLNLDGSHFVKVDNFSIGPSFTALAQVKSDTAAWNAHGWIVSTQNNNGFIIHPNAYNATDKTWSGYIYDNTGNRNKWLAIGTYNMAGKNINDWHTYGVEYDNENKIAKMILDGQVVVSSAISIDRGVSNSNIILYIGHDIYAPTSRFGKGQIDWVYIYNRVLY